MEIELNPIVLNQRSNSCLEPISTR